MNTPTTFLLLVLFIPKNVFSIPYTSSSPKYDIKTCLKDWLNKISEKNEESNTEIDCAVRQAFASAQYHRVKEIEYNVTNLADTFESKIIFHDINFYTHRVDAMHTYRFSLLSLKRKLSADKISVSTQNLRITLEVELRKEKDESFASLFTTLHFSNFVLNATRKSSYSSKMTFSFDLSYESYYVFNHGYYERIKWYGLHSDESNPSSNKDSNSNESDSSSDEDNTNDSDSSDNDSNDSNSSSDDDDSSNRPNLSRYRKEIQFTTEITPMLPKLLQEHINRNPEFSRAFEKTLKVHQSPPKFISLYPNLKKHREVIPQVPFYGFRLRNVVILGLANIELIDIDELPDVFSHTLWIENIQGSMILDYGCKKETPLELNYQISYLLISFKENTDLVNVESRGYRVSPIAGGSLTDLQSAVVMEKIESTVVSVLMPSKKLWKPCSFESKIVKIRNSSTCDWKTIKESYKNWIPFNENPVPRKA